MENGKEAQREIQERRYGREGRNKAGKRNTERRRKRGWMKEICKRRERTEDERSGE
jgi:hypothetical protein